MRKAADIVLLNEERAQLLQLARSKTVSVRLARRAQIVLGAADGLDNRTIAAQWAWVVFKWDAGAIAISRADWRRFEQDLPRGGRPVKADAARDRAPDDTDLA